MPLTYTGELIETYRFNYGYALKEVIVQKDERQMTFFYRKLRKDKLINLDAKKRELVDTIENVCMFRDYIKSLAYMHVEVLSRNNLKHMYQEQYVHFDREVAKRIIDESHTVEYSRNENHAIGDSSSEVLTKTQFKLVAAILNSSFFDIIAVDDCNVEKSYLIQKVYTKEVLSSRAYELIRKVFKIMRVEQQGTLTHVGEEILTHRQDPMTERMIKNKVFSCLDLLLNSIEDNLLMLLSTLRLEYVEDKKIHILDDIAYKKEEGAELQTNNLSKQLYKIEIDILIHKLFHLVNPKLRKLRSCIPHIKLKRVKSKPMTHHQVEQILSRVILKDVKLNIKHEIERIFKNVVSAEEEVDYTLSPIQAEVIYDKIVGLVTDSYKQIGQNLTATLASILTTKGVANIDLKQCIVKACTEDILIQNNMPLLITQTVHKIFEEISTQQITHKINKNIHTSTASDELNYAPSKILEEVINNFKLTKGEHELGVLHGIDTSKVLHCLEEIHAKDIDLFARFWTIAATDYKDMLILPDLDYPYATNPISIGEEQMPDNWHVVYPNNYSKVVDVHPIPFGSNVGLNEIEVDIGVMIEIINILILMWTKFYHAFWGWTGTQAVIGITDSVYTYITLSTSRQSQKEKWTKESYSRCFRWLRWEAEKTALLAKEDMDLHGNYYIEVLINEMINYMLDHHFDIMPIFETVELMDEWRNIFASKPLENDISWVLDKVKGIRHRLLNEE